MTPTSKSTPRPTSNALLAARLVLAVALGAGVAGVWVAYRSGNRDGRVIPGVRLAGRDVGGRSVDRIRRGHQEWEQRLLEGAVTLRYPGGTFQSTFHALGVTPRSGALWPGLRALGRRGGLFDRLLERRRARAGRLRFAPGFGLDPSRALAALRSYKEQVDVRARSARLDLINRRIIPGRVGYELDVYASQERILSAARGGRRDVSLAVREVRPKISSIQLRNLSISTVLGWYETPYSLSYRWRNRTYNLRVAARKLSGTILMPDEEFDFNQVLGPRSQQEGYRIAPVIARGELVDGIAGGLCQISSTLFAAAFFAGLEVVKADVHSMPSHYIDLGLDATVVWPSVTMTLKNPYDFPVVIHYQVNSGRVRAELLGAKRLYKIGFERRIVADRAFKEELRHDDKKLIGTRKVEQHGQRGYTVRRRRIFFDKDGHEVRSQYWTVVYPPTTMIITLGTKKPDDPSAPPPEPLKPVNPMPDPATFVRKIQ
ncbi:MAG: VanW family protein [bacterium]